MLLSGINFLNSSCLKCRVSVILLQRRFFNEYLESKYSIEQKDKILQVINESDALKLSRYELTKSRLKKFTQWKSNNGCMKSLSELHLIEGFTERTAKKLFDSILSGPRDDNNVSSKIRGQILHPHLSESVIKSCKSVLTVYISVNSVCWTHIDKSSYELLEWKYYGIDYPENKRFQITDILDIAWRITRQLPMADVYVMKAEATTLRAAGSDPNNPKVIAVNLQKAQMVAMIVALINARSKDACVDTLDKIEDGIKHKVYFLRPSLPYRLYGGLVGNEQVSTDQTVEMLLDNASGNSTKNTTINVPETLRAMFRSQRDLEKDMLGHCFLLSITFMDLCIYKNQEKINKLVKRGE